MIRTIARQLPLIHDALKKRPKAEGWYWCNYYTWDLKKKDYVELTDVFFFDGSDFRTEHLYDYDGADWITEVIEEQ